MNKTKLIFLNSLSCLVLIKFLSSAITPHNITGFMPEGLLEKVYFIPTYKFKSGSNISFFAKALLHVRVQIIKLCNVTLFGSPHHVTVTNADAGDKNGFQ